MSFLKIQCPTCFGWERDSAGGCVTGCPAQTTERTEIIGTQPEVLLATTAQLDELRNRIIALEEINRSLIDEREVYRRFVQDQLDVLKSR